MVLGGRRTCAAADVQLLLPLLLELVGCMLLLLQVVQLARQHHLFAGHTKRETQPTHSCANGVVA